MVQTINTTHNISDESDGLPMPKRIWAVVSVGFALCMSVLDINIVNIVLPTLSHDFGTTPAVTTWIINGYQLAIVISLLSFSALGGDDRLPEGVSFGHRIVLYHFTDLCAVRFVLDADGGTYFSRVQRFSYYKCEYGAVTVYLPEKSDWPRDGN